MAADGDYLAAVFSTNFSFTEAMMSRRDYMWRLTEIMSTVCAPDELM